MNKKQALKIKDYYFIYLLKEIVSKNVQKEVYKININI